MFTGRPQDRPLRLSTSPLFGVIQVVDVILVVVAVLTVTRLLNDPANISTPFTIARQNAGRRVGGRALTRESNYRGASVAKGITSIVTMYQQAFETGAGMMHA